MAKRMFWAGLCASMFFSTTAAAAVLTVEFSGMVSTAYRYALFATDPAAMGTPFKGYITYEYDPMNPALEYRTVDPALTGGAGGYAQGSVTAGCTYVQFGNCVQPILPNAASIVLAYGFSYFGGDATGPFALRDNWYERSILNNSVFSSEGLPKEEWSVSFTTGQDSVQRASDGTRFYSMNAEGLTFGLVSNGQGTGFFPNGLFDLSVPPDTTSFSGYGFVSFLSRSFTAPCSPQLVTDCTWGMFYPGADSIHVQGSVQSYSFVPGYHAVSLPSTAPLLAAGVVSVFALVRRRPGWPAR